MQDIPIDKISFQGHQIEMLRLDLAYPEVQGNKHFKLKYNLEEAENQKQTTLLTFGGAFSNHLHAVATVGGLKGFKTIGVVRGEDDSNNPTYKYVRSKNMQLHFITRDDYRSLRSGNNLMQSLYEKYGPCYFLPEGGTNQLAIKGCQEVLPKNSNIYNTIFCSVGTGGTISGIISTPGLGAPVIGISPLRAGDQLTDTVKQLLGDLPQPEWQINTDYHFGGFAKLNFELMQFIRQFYSDYNILLDPIYTGKMMFGVFDLIKKNKISKDGPVLCVHTGGLQGWDGWHYRFPNVKPIA